MCAVMGSEENHWQRVLVRGELLFNFKIQNSENFITQSHLACEFVRVCETRWG